MLSVTSPTRFEKFGCRRRDFHPHESHSHKVLAASKKLCASGLPFRHFDIKNFGTGGESRTRNNSFLRRVPLPFGYACILI